MRHNKHKLLEYLKSHKLMSLATFSSKPWISTVYYAVDNQMNLYFVSKPQTRHCKDIASNRHVACAIADSTQKVTSKKTGVQIQGVATPVNDTEKIKWALKMWNKAHSGVERIINLENMTKGVIKSRVYQIKPKLIKFFNEDLYGPEGFEIFIF